MECNYQTLQGTLTAIVTPFTADSSAVDYDSFGKLLEFQIASGVSGIVVCGSTGEAATLNDDEYRKVVSFCREATRQKVLCIAGVGTNSTLRACEMATLLDGIGVDGILLVAPPYNKPSQEGIAEHFRRVKKSTRLPLIAYNIPGRSAVNILPQTLARLAEEGCIEGIKESSGSMDQVMDIAALCCKKASLLSGEDSLVTATMSCGGRGVISASANVIPSIFVELTRAALAGDFAGSLEKQFEALPVVRSMFIETNPVPAKAALKELGLIKHASVRLPLLEASGETLSKLRAILATLRQR
jgi:4-hydroxy-tetrahydrodipicolinate synthase